MSHDAVSATPPTGLLVVSAAALFVGVFLFIRSRLRGTLLALGEVLDERSGTPRGFMANRMTGHAGGREVELHVDPGSRHRPRRFHIRMPCPGEMRIRVARQGVGSRLAGRLGLLQDVEVGDAEFDSRFVLSASDPERLKAWLGRSAEPRMLLASMFDRGVDELTVARGSICATQIAYGRDEVAPDNIRMLLDTLGRFAATAAGA